MEENKENFKNMEGERENIEHKKKVVWGILAVIAVVAITAFIMVADIQPDPETPAEVRGSLTEVDAETSSFTVLDVRMDRSGADGPRRVENRYELTWDSSTSLWLDSRLNERVFNADPDFTLRDLNNAEILEKFLSAQGTVKVELDESRSTAENITFLRVSDMESLLE